MKIKKVFLAVPIKNKQMLFITPDSLLFHLNNTINSIDAYLYSESDDSTAANLQLESFNFEESMYYMEIKNYLVNLKSALLRTMQMKTFKCHHI